MCSASCFWPKSRSGDEPLPGSARIAVIANVLVEGYLLRAMATPPPALPVARLVDHDAENPGAERRMAAEGVNGAEDPQEDLLREIQRFVVIPQQVERQLVDHALMLVDQVGARIFVVRGAALNQQRLSAADLRPGDGSNRLHGETFRHLITRQQ